MKHPKYNCNPNLKPYPTTPSMSPTIYNLPQDIIFNILLRLPTKSLTHFLPLSTSSPPLIHNPSFTHLHLTTTTTITDNNRILIYHESSDYITNFYSFTSPLTFQQTFNLQPPYKTLHGYLQIVGSDKGLICLFDTNYYCNLGVVILWNPCVKKFRIIDHPDNVNQFSHFVIGFGFVSRGCEFKVVEIAYDLEDFKRRNYVWVYSLTSNSWEKKDGASAPCYLTKSWSSSVCVNGFVNWLGFRDDGEVRGACGYIMAFDLENEGFRVFGLPESIEPGYDQVSIDSFGEEGKSLSLSLSLSLCARYVEANVEKWDVWVMGEYGVVDSWKKVFVVSQPLLIPPLLMKSDREVLIAMEDGRLMLLDASKNEVKDLETIGLPRSFRAIRYTASLAMLNG